MTHANIAKECSIAFMQGLQESFPCQFFFDIVQVKSLIHAYIDKEHSKSHSCMNCKKLFFEIIQVNANIARAYPSEHISK